MLVLPAAYFMIINAPMPSVWTIDAPTQRKIAQSVRPFLKRGEIVARVVEAKPHLWAVVSGRVNEPDDDCLHDTSLRLFKQAQGTKLLLIAKQPLTKDENGIREISAEMSPLTGRRSRELALILYDSSGSYYPTFLFAFRADARGLKRLGEGWGAEGAEIRDLNHDGRAELLVTNDIDAACCHGSMPQWTDVYEYRGGRYRLSTTRFPGVIRDQARYIDKMIKWRPDEEQLWIYRGAAQAAFGHRGEARRNIAKGLRALKRRGPDYHEIVQFGEAVLRGKA